jgi:hypothetical protein
VNAHGRRRQTTSSASVAAASSAFETLTTVPRLSATPASASLRSPAAGERSSASADVVSAVESGSV